MSETEALPEESERQVRAMFAGQPFMAHLGAELTALGPGRAEIRLPYRPEVTQHDGFFHGGVIATLADNSGGAAGYTLLGAGQALLTVEFKVNILAPGRGEALVARGRVVRAGRRLVVSSAEVFAQQEGRETLCATQLMTLLVLEPPGAGAATGAPPGAGRRGQDRGAAAGYTPAQ